MSQTTTKATPSTEKTAAEKGSCGTQGSKAGSSCSTDKAKGSCG